MRRLGSYLPLQSPQTHRGGHGASRKTVSLLRLLCRGRCKGRPTPLCLQALRVVNDGAVGSRAGNRWEAQVHKVSLLSGTEKEQSHQKVCSVGN